jgi:ketosteroid isomerase-like protein
MNLTARAPFLFIGVVLFAAGVVGCSQFTAEKQIRERIASIREAILAERAEGIVEFSTPDWRFDTPDRKTFDRSAYLERTRKLFAEIDVESLDTRIDRVDYFGERAEVALTQTIVRIEKNATGAATRWKTRYRETQEWVLTRDRGWLVAHVTILYHPKREALPSP